MFDWESSARVKIRVALIDRGWAKHESFWAEPLGNDLYRMGNIPFYAYDLHLHDIVRAVPEEPGTLPLIQEVVERSGRRTLRIIFAADSPVEDRRQALRTLVQLGVTSEKASDRFFALETSPAIDYRAVCDELQRLEERGILQYETCDTAEWPPEPSPPA